MDQLKISFQLKINFSKFLSAKLIPEKRTGRHGNKRTILINFPFDISEYLYSELKFELEAGNFCAYWYADDDLNDDEECVRAKNWVALIKSLHKQDINHKLFTLEIPEDHPLFKSAYRYFGFED